MRGERGGVVAIVAAALLLAAAGAAAVAFMGWREAHRPGPLTEPAVILVEPGMSVGAIARALREAGAVRHVETFKLAARATGAQGRLKAGEYEVPAGASVLDILLLLEAGKSILHRITLAEGLTTAQILRAVASAEDLQGEVTLTPGEGALLPETYAFTRGETRDAIIQRMIDAQARLLDELWDERALELPFSTRAEAVTLASIVEKETGVAAERARIAAVFVNRLRRGMRLESDPTVIYGISGGEPLGRGLRESELRKETPYNTYRRGGLPPTPIANPGRDSIAAVLNPMQTDEIFFVADGSGGHAFAVTLREHNENVARWRRIEAESR